MISWKNILLFAAVATAPLTATAELVWTKDEGWKIQGGVLADLGLTTPEQRRTALEKMNEAKRLQDEGSYSSALSIYNDVIEEYPGSDFAAEAFFQRGVVLFKRSEFEGAFGDLDELLRKHPEFHRFNDIIEEQYSIATAVKNGERPYLWGWMPWFKNYTKGLEFFDTINRNAPYGPRAEQALYDKGMLALKIDKNAEALDAFERLINNYPNSKLTPDAYIALAQTHSASVIGPQWDQGSTIDALNFYNDLVALFPDSHHAPEALKLADEMREVLAQNRLDLGLFYYERRNNNRAAAIFFNEAINAAPESETAKQAQKLLADIRAGKKAARNPMDWLFGRYPQSAAGDFVDAPSQAGLETMGFTTEDEKPGNTPVPAAPSHE
ncbi:MAG: outer membrane protein assembly factor BamD [Puniceicoccales bacterium]|jgi:outer membrane protein assembly factor BamD|nr:outer membrane protein assembly factor BamD [Puniceicoccales bacterium]